MATQAAPPPPKWLVPTWGPAKMTRQHPPAPATTRQHPPAPANTRHDPPWPAIYHMTGGGGKGMTRHFSKCSLIKDYFKRLISHNRLAKLAPSLLQCQSSPISFLRAVIRENVSYIVTRAYKRPTKTTSHSQSATLHSTGNISVEGSVTRTKPATTAHVE